jgi:hypothetical protein
VNSRYYKLGEMPCHASIAAVPEAPDCAVLCVPQDAVVAVVRECADAGVGAAVIFASGFAETGRAETVAEQRELTAIARRSGMRIIGPNCLGFANYSRAARVTFSEYPRASAANAVSVGIASQSGALSQSLAQAIERGVSISHSISTGNSCDVDVADLVAYLADDPGCRAIACVFEGMADPTRTCPDAGLAALAPDGGASADQRARETWSGVAAARFERHSESRTGNLSSGSSSRTRTLPSGHGVMVAQLVPSWTGRKGAAAGVGPMLCSLSAANFR